VARRDLTHPAVPTLAAVVLGALYLVAAPDTADMAAHTYRTWLWHQVGFATWNAQWYGGHHMAGYSLLYPPLAAVAGTRLVGVAAAVAAVWLFARLARRRASTPAVGALAAWLFLAGVMSNVVIGRMPFTLGVALAVAAWVCTRRSLWGAAALSLLSVWASPVCGVFLIVAAAAVLAGARPRDDAPERGADGGVAPGKHADWPTAVALGAPAVAGGLAMALLFPEGGTDHFVAAAFWPMLLICIAALALVDPRRRTALWAGGLYVAVLVAAFAFPNALGQNALRPGAILGPALLVLLARPRAPRLAVAAVAVVLLYLQWLPAVRAVDEARGDPSTAAAYHAPVLEFLAARAKPGERVEVPLTRNHWEATHLARSYPLARGWHRQLDRKVNPLFYAQRPLTPARYEAWLRDNAVRWIALPDAPLDFSAGEERRLLLRGAPFLRRVHRSAHWTIWEVRDALPPVSGPARLTAAGADGFDLEASRPGWVLVRQHGTPYWTVERGDGCVMETSAGWTLVDVHAAGHFEVRARFSAGGALRRKRDCRGSTPDPPGPGHLPVSALEPEEGRR
jgi:hypothetical protein